MKKLPLSKLLGSDSSGIALLTALFMVLLITFIVNEINFETNVEYTVNAQNLHRLNAYYAAKAGVEISKLRIKVYRSVMNSLPDSMGAQAQMFNMIYSFPFAWPPASLPDMTSVDKEAMDKVVKESKMAKDTSYLTTIQTEDKININDLNSPSEYQRKKVRAKLEDLFKHRLEQDDEWAKSNRDMHYDEIINNIKDFIDPDIEAEGGGAEIAQYGNVKELDKDSDIRLPPNRYFRTIEEVRMVPGVTDEVFAILEPVITIFGPFGINPNHADKEALKSLHTSFTDDVVTKLIARRDNPNEGGPYSSADDFFNYATASGAKLTEEDMTKVPLTFANPCHFRITSDGLSGKVKVTIVAITYDLDCQVKEVSTALKKEEAEKKPTDPSNPDVTSGTIAEKDKSNNKKPAPLPKGPPRIVYWEER